MWFQAQVEILLWLAARQADAAGAGALARGQACGGPEAGPDDGVGEHGAKGAAVKIERKDIPQITIEEFADKYDLTMEIHERPLPEGASARFYAHFKSCEIMDRGCLRGTFGDGATPEEAIKDYAASIRLCRIVIDARHPTRREIEVPRLV